MKETQPKSIKEKEPKSMAGKQPKSATEKASKLNSTSGKTACSSLTQCNHTNNAAAAQARAAAPNLLERRVAPESKPQS